MIKLTEKKKNIDARLIKKMRMETNELNLKVNQIVKEQQIHLFIEIGRN